MANDVYEKIDNKNVSLDYMLTYSLGGDLARFSKCRRTCHKIKMEEFISNMWQYIKDNNKVNDKDYMGTLYGHICHYYMDSVCHPLIRKVDKISTYVGFKSHTLIEGYIDSYLVKYKYNLDMNKFKTNYIFKGKIRKIYKMIDYVYEKTYSVKYVSFSYFITKILYSKIRFLFILFGKNMLRSVFKFNKYISVNKDIDIINLSKKIEYKNYLDKNVNDSFVELYDESIKLAICRINGLE
jgi:hypothetical protein